MSNDPHVSPSQLDTFLHCPRKWAFDKIAHLPRVENKYAARGHAVHKVLEDYSRFNVWPDKTDMFGQIAYPAREHIPPPQTPGVTPERMVEWYSPETDNLWVFLKDLEQVDGQHVVITDYKTTSNLSYAKTAEVLVNSDPQGIVYARHAFVEYQAETVDLKWLYLPTKTRKCLPVLASPGREHNASRFELLDSVASVMISHVKQQTDPMRFRACPAYCPAFGGCERKSVCNLSAKEKYEAILLSTQPVNNTSATAAFLSQITQIQNGGAVNPAPVAVQVPVAVQQVPTVAVQTTPAVVAVAPSARPWLRPAVQPAPAPVQPPAVQAEQSFPTPVAIPNETVSTETIPAPPPTPTDEQPLIKKRARRTKAQIEADTAAEQGTYQTADMPEQEDLSQGREHPDSGQQAVAGRSRILISVTLAMASNPGYAGLDSVAFVERAAAITGALQEAIQ